MNKIFQMIAATFAAIIYLVSCSGTIDPVQGEEENNNQPEVVPEGVLRIFADKSEIMADGNEEVTFTVMFGSKDVSNEKTLQLIRVFEGEEKYMAYGANKFSTVTAGTYKFKAKFYYGGNNFTDNEVEVVAKQFFTGEAQEFERRYLGILFTSTGCTSCPTAAKGLADLKEQNPGKISLVAFHKDFSTGMPDPMTIPETDEMASALGGFTGLPAFFWNMRKSSYTGGAQYANFYAETLAKEQAEYETYSGVNVTADYNQQSGSVTINVGITSNMPNVFRYLVMLVEDGITGYEQMSNSQNSKEYVHNNVVRDVVTSVNGDKLNDGLPLTVGVEAKASKTVTLGNGWKPENMRVVVATLTSDDGGYNWTANNVNECKVK